MDKKILVGYDGSEPSLRAIDYVGFMFQGRSDVHINVLYLMNPLPSIPEEPDIGMRKKLVQQKERLEKERKEQAEESLERARKSLIKKNIDPANISTETEFQVMGKAGDLLQKAEKESSYDAIAVGRRGLGAFSKMFLGSVSIELVQMEKNIPVIVVGGVQESKKVLVAVDDSRNSLQAVDYVSFILGSDWEVEFTLFSAVPSLKSVLGDGVSCEISDLENCYLTEEERKMNRFFQKAEEIFNKAGVSSSRIKTKIKRKSFNIAKDIQKEAISGNYGSIILGRRGKSGLKSLVMGRVSLKTLALIEDRAIWIVG